MKRIIYIILLALTLSGLFNYASAQSYDQPLLTYTPSFDVTHRNLSQIILDDGVYELKVEYKSHTTHSTQYVLDVCIQNDTITAIYFGNGGSVHRGHNNGGYIWNGGGIRWSTDYYGNIISGYAIVQVSYNGGGWQLFTIRL